MIYLNILAQFYNKLKHRYTNNVEFIIVITNMRKHELGPSTYVSRLEAINQDCKRYKKKYIYIYISRLLLEHQIYEKKK